MAEFFNNINAEINWYLSLEKADFLGVTAFLICIIGLICLIVRLIVKLVKSYQNHH